MTRQMLLLDIIPQNIFAVRGGQIAADLLEDLHITLVLIVVIGRDTDRFDQADVEFPGDNCCRHQTAARDADDGPPLLFSAGNTPGQCARVAMKLIP